MLVKGAICVMEDKRIVELFELEADKAIYAFDEKYGRALFQRANQILENVEDAKECINECYLKMWQNVPKRLKNSDALFSYAFATISNIARNMRCRDRKYYVELNDELMSWEQTTDPIENIINRMIVREVMEEICKGSNEICLRVVARRYRNNEPVRKVALDEGLSEASVKMYCRRFRQRVAKALAQRGAGI